MGFQKMEKKEKEIIILKQTETNENFSIKKRLHHSHMHLHYIDERIRIILWFNVVSKHKRTIELVFIIVYIMLKIFNMQSFEWMKGEHFSFWAKNKNIGEIQLLYAKLNWKSNNYDLSWFFVWNSILSKITYKTTLRIYELAQRLRTRGKGIIWILQRIANENWLVQFQWKHF